MKNKKWLTFLMILSMIFLINCGTMPKPEPIQEPIQIKVKYPVPSQRLVDFIKTGPSEVKRDFANYMIEVKGLASLTEK